MTDLLNKKKLIRDISASSFQTVFTQFFGLGIFYFTSRYLSKDDFGEFNWSMAVSATVIAIASLGLDLVFVKRVASGKDIVTISGVHFFHTTAVAIVLSGLTFAIHLLWPGFSASHPLYAYVFAGLAIANMGNSFKLCLNGLEAYNHLAWLSLISNGVKFAGILLLYLIHQFGMLQVVMVYLLVSALEFGVGYVLLTRSLQTRVKPLLRINEYKYFILESLPQLGVVLFDSALARIDWILLGVMSTAVITAEYSFAYKLFELAKLPLLILSPILLTRFSKLFANDQSIDPEKETKLKFLLRFELAIMMCIPIVLVCVWSPLMDLVSSGKYGAVNQTTFRILAFCIPMHAIINFLWTLAFVKNQLKKLMLITISSSLLNVAGNLWLIPLFGGIGAAWAFLGSTVFQLALYIFMIRHPGFHFDFKNMILAFVNASLSVFISIYLFENSVWGAFSALFIYIILARINKQIDLKSLKLFFKES